MYYLRTKAAVEAIAGLGVDLSSIQKPKEAKEYSTEEAVSCSLDNPEACEACGS
jgi:ribonucleoside-diphosphate reductase alpha chain